MKLFFFFVLLFFLFFSGDSRCLCYCWCCYCWTIHKHKHNFLFFAMITIGTRFSEITKRKRRETRKIKCKNRRRRHNFTRSDSWSLNRGEVKANAKSLSKFSANSKCVSLQKKNIENWFESLLSLLLFYLSLLVHFTMEDYLELCEIKS